MEEVIFFLYNYLSRLPLLRIPMALHQSNISLLSVSTEPPKGFCGLPCDDSQ